MLSAPHSADSCSGTELAPKSLHIRDTAGGPAAAAGIQGGAAAAARHTGSGCWARGCASAARRACRLASWQRQAQNYTGNLSISMDNMTPRSCQRWALLTTSKGRHNACQADPPEDACTAQVKPLLALRALNTTSDRRNAGQKVQPRAFLRRKLARCAAPSRALMRLPLTAACVSRASASASASGPAPCAADQPSGGPQPGGHPRAAFVRSLAILASLTPPACVGPQGGAATPRPATGDIQAVCAACDARRCRPFAACGCAAADADAGAATAARPPPPRAA